MVIVQFVIENKSMNVGDFVIKAKDSVVFFENLGKVSAKGDKKWQILY